MDGAASNGPDGNLMGQLRCLIEKPGLRNLSGYKKRFWVVNYKTKRLEVYKNDQSHEPANVYRAEDIRGVIYTGDKQNKFFAMILQTRLKQNVKFRMSSLEDRERWARAITRLIDAFSTSHRRNNVFEFLQRRTLTVGRSLDVSIVVDWPRLLTAPREVLEYTVEAVDSALTNVAALVTNYGTDIAVPKSFTLNLQTLEAAPASVEGFPGPQYDPVKSSAVLSVVLYKDSLGHVKFYVTEPEELISIMQSNVFRNPLIEGWIHTSPGCAETCEAIRAALRITDRPFPITFQWGQHLSDTSRVERYLQEFVNEGFFRGVLAVVKETLRDIERMLQNLLQLPISTGPTPAATPRDFPGNLTETATVTGGRGGGGPLHTRSFSAMLFLPSDVGGGGGGAAAASRGSFDRDETNATGGVDPTSVVASANAAVSGHMATMAELQAAAVRLLSDNITGLAITLEKRTVQEGRAPPLLVVEHTVEYGNRSRPAFLLAAKHRQVYAQPSAPTVSLHDQLFEVAFHALLSKQVSSLRSRLNSVFRGKVKVAIMWDRLIQVCHRIGAPLFQRDLPRLVNALADLYLPRMQRMVELMTSSRAGAVQATTSSAYVSPLLASLQHPQPPPAGRRPSGSTAAGPSSPMAPAIIPTTVFGSVDGAAMESAAGAGDRSPLRAVHNASFFGAAGGAGPTASPALLEESELTLFDVFSQCVGSIVIDFLSFADVIAADGGNVNFPDPTLVNGVLTDTILCSDEATAPTMVGAVNQRKGGTARESPALVRGVHAYAANPRLGAWCEWYFGTTEHVSQSSAGPRRVVEDEFASGSDAGIVEAPLDLDKGEAVANERRAEISVLNMKRVVNAIYDSQGELIDLKIGAREIGAAIRSFQRAFKGKRVTKHDLIRVFTTNLRRLRNMYSRATGGEVDCTLSESTATRLLESFCDYEETAALAAFAVRARRSDAARVPGSPLWAWGRSRPPAPPSLPTKEAVGPGTSTGTGTADGGAARDGREPTVAPSASRPHGLSISSSSNSGENGGGRGSAPTASLSDANERTSEFTESPVRGPRSRRHTVQPEEMLLSMLDTTAGGSASGVGQPLVSATTAPFSLSVRTSGGRMRSQTSRLAAAACTANADESAGGNLTRGNTMVSVSASTGGMGTDELTTRLGSSAVAPSGAGVQLAGATSARDRFSEVEGATDVERTVDFQLFCAVALNVLLPREAVIARRGWRTGFVFGLESTGKSHIVNSICCLPRPTVPTVGLSRQVVAFDEFVLSLNELGGRESFRRHWTFYAKRMEDVHFLLHVVDCSRQSTYDESIKYLKEVASHFDSKPLIIVFNNYQLSPFPKPLKDLAYEYEVDKIQKINKRRRIFMCTHELCVVHPNPKPTPMTAELYETMRGLADVLFKDTPDAEKPMKPKGLEEDFGASTAGFSANRGRGRLLPGRPEESWRDNSSMLFDYASPGVVRQHSDVGLDTGRGFLGNSSLLPRGSWGKTAGGESHSPF